MGLPQHPRQAPGPFNPDVIAYPIQRVERGLRLSFVRRADQPTRLHMHGNALHQSTVVSVGSGVRIEHSERVLRKRAQRAEAFLGRSGRLSVTERFLARNFM